jgi:hypothetical protein
MLPESVQLHVKGPLEQQGWKQQGKDHFFSESNPVYIGAEVEEGESQSRQGQGDGVGQRRSPLDEDSNDAGDAQDPDIGGECGFKVRHGRGSFLQGNREEIKRRARGFGNYRIQGPAPITTARL